MSSKRPVPEPAPAIDEWGIYDPAKAGMQALYARLGKPVIRASSKSLRQQRRQGLRPERTNEGVGLAIEEAMRRADQMTAAARPPVVGLSPAHAVKLTPTAETLPATATPRRKRTRRAQPDAAAASAAPDASSGGPDPVRAGVAAPLSAAPHVDARAEAVSATCSSTPRKPAKSRVKADAMAASPAEVTPAPLPQAAPAAPVPPAPSPGRPRGPVPLAAWAHAVNDTPHPERRRGDRGGFWRGIFRIPAEVALVEYGRGCRIHRLLIEASDTTYPIADLL